MFQKVKRYTISQQIIQQIKDMILNGNLVPGQKLPPEREMAEIFSVSRSSVREAVRGLQYMGLLDIRPNDGIYLNENVNVMADHLKFNYLLRKFSFMELVEVRRILEVGIVRLLAENVSEEMKATLHSVFEESLGCLDDPDGYVKYDYAFHEALAEATQNSLLVDMVEAMRDLVLESNIELVKRPGQVRVAVDFHREILNAINEGDSRKAERVMLEHFENVSETLEIVSESELANKAK